jgi:dipeptidyl aminopeptidase/acylaminoacyl peptidase
MKIKKILTITFALLILAGCGQSKDQPANSPIELFEDTSSTSTIEPTSIGVLENVSVSSPWSSDSDPLQIGVMRRQSYPGSQLTFEQTLPPGTNYNQYIVSYLADGYKIYALMTIPFGDRPETGWPVIVFNHGYINPSEYRTTERYVAYVDAIAQHGYIVFKADYRGHGDSEGSEVIGGGYGTPGYTNDILNAIASLKLFSEADPKRIGMWGHSMGGQITLRAMVVSNDIKAGVIWGGVVAPYPEIIGRWDYTKNPSLFPGMFISDLTSPQNTTENWLANFSNWVKEFSLKYGEPLENPDFWATISPNSFLSDLSGPIQLHHSTTDEEVPINWAEILAGELQNVGMAYEFYTYEGDNHNISGNFSVAMQRTIDFFDKYVKGQ